MKIWKNVEIKVDTTADECDPNGKKVRKLKMTSVCNKKLSWLFLLVNFINYGKYDGEFYFFDFYNFKLNLTNVIN